MPARDYPPAEAMRRSLRAYIAARFPIERARHAEPAEPRVEPEPAKPSVEPEPAKPDVRRDRLALTRRESAEAMGMGLTSFEQYVQPDVKLIRKGRMRLVPVSELERWIDENAESTLRED